jgi:hypothetical protein
MRLAYIILAHKLPGQVVRLVKKLNTSTATFLIHVDRKAPEDTYKKITEALASFENVHFLQRCAIYYGDYGHVRATLAGIRRLVELRTPFDYVILITGQDYPIKSNEQIETFLRGSGQRSFMEFFPLPDERWGDENGGLDRVNYWHLHWRGRELPLMKRVRSLLRIPEQTWSSITKVFPFQRQPPIDLKWFGGSSYWCLTKECIDYVDELTKGNKGLVKFFEHIGIPGEIFFQTLLLNSPFKDQVINDSLRYIVWSNARHPLILKVQHFDQFMKTENLFARKFDITVDETVLDMIDMATS